ncbi:hypothetical protein BJX96DRAFT_151503 [Aspergillus floccosus]
MLASICITIGTLIMRTRRAKTDKPCPYPCSFPYPIPCSIPYPVPSDHNQSIFSQFHLSRQSESTYEPPYLCLIHCMIITP